MAAGSFRRPRYLPWSSRSPNRRFGPIDRAMRKPFKKFEVASRSYAARMGQLRKSFSAASEQRVDGALQGVAQHIQPASITGGILR